MKKSITILALAIVSFANASNSKDSVSYAVKNGVVSETKFISNADPSLIQSELGNLQKVSKTIDQIIADDLKITEAVIPAKISLKLKKDSKKTQPVQFKKALQN